MIGTGRFMHMHKHNHIHWTLFDIKNYAYIEMEIFMFLEFSIILLFVLWWFFEEATNRANGVFFKATHNHFSHFQQQILCSAFI